MSVWPFSSCWTVLQKSSSNEGTIICGCTCPKENAVVKVSRSRPKKRRLKRSNISVIWLILFKFSQNDRLEIEVMNKLFELIFWLKIFLSPFVLLNVIGFIIYLSDDNLWWVWVAFGALGSVLGIYGSGISGKWHQVLRRNCLRRGASRLNISSQLLLQF